MKNQEDEIVKQLPLEEKVAQLQGIFLNRLLEDGKVSEEKCRELIPYGIGHVCQFGSCNMLLPEELVEAVQTVQEYNRRVTKGKVPVLFHEEAISGVAARGAAMFPQVIGISCSWNPELLYQNAAMTAENLKKLGSYYVLSPMVDVITDARWGRIEEGFGESPALAAEYAIAFMKGIRSKGVACTAKHFAGYGVENQDPVFFRNETLFPYEAAIHEQCVDAVMPGYHLFHGIPCSASEELLHEILRKTLGFDGLIVSDYGAVRNVWKSYQQAESTAEAAITCLNVGVDVDFPNGECYASLPEHVRNGRISEAKLDEAVTRVLRLKQSVGQLEYRETDPEETVKKIDLDGPEYRKQARKSARESIVLLKNNGILPLGDGMKKIAVVGPNADSYYSLMGDYTWAGLHEFFYGDPADREHPKLVTLLDGMKNHCRDGWQIRYERGCGWNTETSPDRLGEVGDERGLKAGKMPKEPVPETNWERAIELAKESDVILAAMGENRYLCGECCNRETVGLPGDQERFVQELCGTGKPVVLILFGGRPLAIETIAKNCAAVLYAWYPGEEGGNAAADILCGDCNPCAKLTVSLPTDAKLQEVSAGQAENGKNKGKTPMFPFGYGLSYTQFAYGEIAVPEEISCEDLFFEVSYTVKNIGTCRGTEIPQIYLRKAGEEKKKLFGFARCALEPGETRRIIHKIPLDLLAAYEQSGELWVRGGDYEIEIGASSRAICGTSLCRVGGAGRRLEQRNQYFSEWREETE